MNTAKPIDDIMNEMNEWAKAESRYLGRAFWQIASEPCSILDVVSTPEAEQRLASLRARRLGRRKEAAGHKPASLPQDAAEESISRSQT